MRSMSSLVSPAVSDGTVTAVRPPARFGGLVFEGDLMEDYETRTAKAEGVGNPILAGRAIEWRDLEQRTAQP